MGFWDRLLYEPAKRFNEGLPERNRSSPGHEFSRDWCRFRKNSRCLYPEELNTDATKVAGYAVWVPTDRGFCPRTPWEDQEACPVSEPGPNSGRSDAQPDATVSWEEGGQRR